MAHALGPYPLPGQEAEDLPLIPVSSEPDPRTGLTLDGEAIIGVLRPFNGRARAILLTLYRGGSRGMAAMAGGVDVETMRLWEKKHPEFARATTQAASWGFTHVFERELYNRALAGNDDRGSMRALELIVKARDSAYREKSQMAIDIQVRAEEAAGQLAGGWQRVISAPAEPSEE